MDENVFLSWFKWAIYVKHTIKMIITNHFSTYIQVFPLQSAKLYTCPTVFFLTNICFNLEIKISEQTHFCPTLCNSYTTKQYNCTTKKRIKVYSIHIPFCWFKLAQTSVDLYSNIHTFIHAQIQLFWLSKNLPVNNFILFNFHHLIQQPYHLLISPVAPFAALNQFGKIYINCSISV